MLDTIKLCIPLCHCKINNTNIFTPTIGTYLKRQVKYICNPNYKTHKLYLPKLTAFRDYNNENQLLIEFSAPKLLFGNNFDELETKNFSNVINTLYDRLKYIGIDIEYEYLQNAKIFGIHFSKNIALENVAVSNILNTIEKLNITQRLDITKTDYKNGGKAIRFHTNSYELTFYDKVADLKQSLISEKRAIENDNIIQQNLLNRLVGKEILRMEVRLNKSKKIVDVLHKCGIENIELNFKQLFDENISKRILNYFWNEYIGKSIYVVCQSYNANDIIYSKCLMAGFSQSKALKIVGIMATIQNNGCRKIKEIVKQSFNKFLKDIELLNLDDNFLLKQFSNIRTKLQRMYPLKI